MPESKPMPWAELRERVDVIADRTDISGDVREVLYGLLDDIDAAAPAMMAQERLAEACGELDADTVKTCSVPLWLRVRRHVIDQIQEAWLDWKGVPLDERR